MSFFGRVLNAIVGSSKKPTRRKTPGSTGKQSFRPGIEQLETREVPSVTVLSNIFTSGDVARLEANGQLVYSSASGTTLLDNQAKAIAVGVNPAGQATLFDLKFNGVLYSYGPTSGFALLDNTGTSTVVPGVDSLGHAAVFDLQSNGRLYQYGVGGFALLDNQAGKIASGVNAAGRAALFDLKLNNDTLSSSGLYMYGVGGFTLLDNQTNSIETGVTAGGQPALFDLKIGGTLYQYSIGGFTLLDNQTRNIVSGYAPNGQPALFDLKTTNKLYQYTIGGFTLLDDQSSGIAPMASTTSQRLLLDVKTNAKLYTYGPSGFALLVDNSNVPSGDTSSSTFYHAPTNSTTTTNLLNAVLQYADNAYQAGRGDSNVPPGQTSRSTIGTGECTDLAIAALNYARAKTTYDYGVTGKAADYVWGDLIREHSITGNIGDDFYTSRGYVRPGDVVQYRNVITSHTDGNTTHSSNAPHHTAIIKQDLGNGVYEVYEQNSNDIKHVVVNTIDLLGNGFQSGTVWLYQPVKVGTY